MNKTEQKRKVQTGCPNCIVPGSDGVMPIVAFNGPIRSYHSSERGWDIDFTSHNFLQERYFQLIAECGINVVTHFEDDYSRYPQDMIQALEWAEKYGFKLFLSDYKLRADMSEEELTNRIAEYGRYHSFGGIKIIDEPCTRKFPTVFDGAQKLSVNALEHYAPLARRLNSYDNLIGYINLFPYYYWMESTVEDYKEYIEEYLETCNPKIISYDNYPFDLPDREACLRAFFINLTVVRSYALKHNIPFWAFAQCGSQWNFQGKPIETEEYRPTKWEFFWSANTELAFGAKGMEYFPLVQPYDYGMYLDGGIDGDRCGILGADGEPTMWHGFVRQMNKQVNAVGSILMQCDSVGVIAKEGALTHAKGLEGILESDQYKELVAVETEAEGAFVGCFDYEGKTVLYVVNNGTKKCQSMTLRFDNEYRLQFLSAVRNDVEETDVCQFILGAGSAVLIIVSDKVNCKK